MYVNIDIVHAMVAISSPYQSADDLQYANFLAPSSSLQAPRAQARSEHQATSPLQHLPRGVTPGSLLTEGKLKRIQQLDAKHQREEAKRQRSEHNRARPRGLQAELQRDRQAAPTSAGDDDTINEDDAEFYAGFGVRLNSGRVRALTIA